MNVSLKKSGVFFLLPTLAAFTIAFLIPFIMGLYLSFTEFTTVTNSKWVGLKNYIRIFTESEDFVNALVFTVKVTVVTVILVNVFAFVLALLLTRGLRGTNFFRTVFFMPNLIGGIVLGYIWQLIINGILRNFGYDITYSADFGFWGMVALSCWQLTGYMMIIYISALQSIPQQIYEAAAIDGASPTSLLFGIKIPLVMPSVTVCVFLTLTNCFKTFDQNLALTAGAPGKASSMLALDIYNTFYGRVGSEGVGQAKAVIFFIIVSLIALLQLKLTSAYEYEK